MARVNHKETAEWLSRVIPLLDFTDEPSLATVFNSAKVEDVKGLISKEKKMSDRLNFTLSEGERVATINRLVAIKEHIDSVKSRFTLVDTNLLSEWRLWAEVRLTGIEAVIEDVGASISGVRQDAWNALRSISKLYRDLCDFIDLQIRHASERAFSDKETASRIDEANAILTSFRKNASIMMQERKRLRERMPAVRDRLISTLEALKALDEKKCFTRARI